MDSAPFSLFYTESWSDTTCQIFQSTIDSRTQEDINKLKSKGVYALPYFSVESIYYHPDIIKRITRTCPALSAINGNPDLLFDQAKNAALSSISKNDIQRLSVKVSEKAIRDKIFKQLPRNQDISKGTPVNIMIEVLPIVEKGKVKLTQAISDGNLHSIVTRYPIRETQALSEIAKKLGFQNCKHYEESVLKLLLSDTEPLDFVRKLFDTLHAETQNE